VLSARSNVTKAYEDNSEIVSSLSKAWVEAERPGNVIPTYQIMDESGKITNEAEFPTDVRLLIL